MNNKFLNIFLALTLACVMLITFVACKNGENDGETENVNTSESIEETTTEEPTETTEALADMSIKWHPEEFLPNLKFMGIGMLCIFIVIAVIILAIYLTSFLTNRSGKKEKKSKKSE